MQYEDTLQSYVSALYKEVHFLKEEGGRRYKIFNGKKTGNEKEGFAYEVECDTELFLPDSFPVRIEYSGKKYYGEIMMIEGFNIWIVTKTDFGPELDFAYLICEPWNLLEALIKRLLECGEGKRTGLSRLLVEKGDILAEPLRNRKVLAGQENALNHAENQPITIIWGPPGTGKTYTLAQIALNFYLQGLRVLIVSHSNVSVDGAVNRILETMAEKKMYEDVRQGSILRYGFIKDEKLAAHPTASAYNYVLTSDADLSQKKIANDNQIKASKNSKNPKNIDALHEEHKNISLKIKELERKAVSEAGIVATTASKAAVEKLFYENGNFDVVIFDEVSMAYVPQIIYASSLAEEKLICLGDFKQLSPIAQSPGGELLRKDLFSILNICDDQGHVNYHPWLVMLQEQRRTAPGIVQFVNEYMYGGMISSSDKNTLMRTDAITQMQPFTGYPQVMIDMTGIYNAAGKTSDNSRFNIMNAMVSVTLAMDAVKNGTHSVGIITPYTAQARLIRALLHGISAKYIDSISCATVHQFQGSERDVIIFDTVENYPGTRCGLLLRTTENRSTERLINVAVTRAKGKLITVANDGYWSNLLDGKRNMLLELLKFQKTHGLRLRDEDLEDYFLETHVPTIQRYSLAKCNSADIDKFLGDLYKAKLSVVMVIPEGKMEQELADRISEYILYAQRLGTKVFVKAAFDAKIPGSLSEMVERSKNATFPLTIIDERVVWYGMPYLDANFVIQGTKLETKTWYSFRFVGEKFTELIKAFAELDVIKDIHGHREKKETKDKLEKSGLKGYIESKYTCPDCGAPLTLRKNRSYYLGCKECRHTEYLTTDMVNAYICKTGYVCGKHWGVPTAKLGKYGVYVHCESGGHFIDVGEL